MKFQKNFGTKCIDKKFEGFMTNHPDSKEIGIPVLENQNFQYGTYFLLRGKLTTNH